MVSTDLPKCRILVTLQKSYPTTNTLSAILDALPVKCGGLESLNYISS